MDSMGVHRFKRASITSVCQLLPRMVTKKLMWLLQKLPHPAGDWLQVVWSLFFSSREGALAGGSGHQYRGSPGECYKDMVVIFIF